MFNRIDQKFKGLHRQKKKAFIAFITAGDPNLTATEKLVLAFEKNGVDIVELGIPFSDPMADGTTIQASSQRALRKHVTANDILDLVARIRKKSQIPIALMTYYNPVFHFGEEGFVKRARQKGVDGLIIPDLPPEEAGKLIKAAQRNNMATVFFLSPMTTDQRRKKIIQASSGFIYYVSLTGVTGARQRLVSTIAGDVKKAKRLTNKPICVGFGISTPSQVRQVGKFADGVIVGSAIINEMVKHKNNRPIEHVSRFVSKLSKALK